MRGEGCRSSHSRVATAHIVIWIIILDSTAGFCGSSTIISSRESICCESRLSESVSVKNEYHITTQSSSTTPQSVTKEEFDPFRDDDRAKHNVSFISGLDVIENPRNQVCNRKLVCECRSCRRLLFQIRLIFGHLIRYISCVSRN